MIRNGNSDAVPTALDQLTALVPLPTRPRPVDWSAVERSLGHRLPTDYRRLVDTYGAGQFDGFLGVFEPLSDNDNLDLLAQRRRQLDGLRFLERGGQVVPYPIAGPQPALLPWGITVNGDVGYWVRTPAEDPDAWPVTVNDSRAPEWCEFAGTLTEFLYVLLTRAYRCRLFPDNFPTDQHTFRPYRKSPDSG